MRRVYLFVKPRRSAKNGPTAIWTWPSCVDGPADPVSLWMAGEDIASRLDVDVDLIDLLTADHSSSSMQIVTKVETENSFAADPVDAERYEIFILNDMMESE